MFSTKKIGLSYIFILTIIVNILIPKAGLKIVGIPITLGSLLLMILIVQWIIQFPQKINKFYGFVLFYIVFWGVVTLGGIFINGIPDGNILYTKSRVFSYIVSFCISPIVFFVVNKNIKNRNQLEYILKVMDYAVLFVLLYACMQYVFGIEKIQIPGITVNYSDYIVAPSNWFRGKANAVSADNSKIISTYQNGNLFGANMLLLFPLMNAVSNKSKTIKYVGLAMFCFCSLVSGSRSFLFGMAIYMILVFVQSIQEGKISKRTLFYVFLLVGVAAVVLYGMIQSNNDYLERAMAIFDGEVFRGLSNRLPKLQGYIDWIKDGHMINILWGAFCMPHSGEAFEMVWAGVFIFGGILGEIVFLIPFLKSLSVVQRHKKNSKIAKGLYNSLLIYMIVAFVEGAYWLLPTSLNVWLVIALCHKYQQLNYEERV